VLSDTNIDKKIKPSLFKEGFFILEVESN